MQEIIQEIISQLATQTMIPADVWLTRLILSAPQESRSSKVTFKARSQGVYYTFEGSRGVHFSLTFWQPRIQVPFKRHFGGSGGKFRFSETQLMLFLAKSGDENPLHQGEMPVIPGLLIANWCLEHIPLHEHAVIVKFKQPLLVNQGFDLAQTDYGYCLTDGKTIFTEIQTNFLGDDHEHKEFDNDEHFPRE